MFLTPKELAQRVREDAMDLDARDQQLDLSKKQVMHLFKEIAKRGDQIGYTESYGMFNNNCIHRVLALLQEFAKNKWRSLTRRVLKLAFNSTEGILAEAARLLRNFAPSGSINSFLPIIQKVLYRHGHVKFEQATWRPLNQIDYVTKYLSDEIESKE